MSQEIIVSGNLYAAKGQIVIQQALPEVKADWTGEEHVRRSQAIGTTHEQIEIPADITAAGIAQIINLDETNYVEIGLVVSATFYPFSKIRPGHWDQLWLAPGVTYYAKANTAAVKISFTVLQE